jgi:arginyl-tRNA synthetase
LATIYAVLCGKKNELVEETSTEELASILCDWAFNMKKNNGEDYKDSAVKTIMEHFRKTLQISVMELTWQEYTNREIKVAGYSGDCRNG